MRRFLQQHRLVSRRVYCQIGNSDSLQAARPDIIPTLDDDGTPTKMNVIQIIDSAEPETKGFSQCFIGVVPMKQEALYNKINNAVEAHRGSGDPFAR